MLDAMTAAVAPRRGRPPRGQIPLSKAAIVDATLAIIDTAGSDAVSMRSIARTLGVDAKSLYNHIDDKDGLLDAVAERLLGAMELPTPIGDVREDLLAIGDAFRAVALRHPQAAPLVLNRQLASFDGLAPVDAVLAVLREAGFDADHAVHLLRALIATLIGTLLREVHASPTYGTNDPAAVKNRTDALRGSGLAHVSDAAASLAQLDFDAEYAYTLNLMIDAIVDRLDRRRGAVTVSSD